MIFGKHRVKADTYSQRNKINILQSVINGGFRKPEGLDGLFGGMLFVLRKLFAQSGNDSVSYHQFSFGRNSGNNKNKFPFNRQGKARRCASGVGDYFRSLREHGLLGIIFHPA